jgi:hypothetical protein
MTDEIMNEFKAMKPVDLHLGPAEVKKFGQESWIKKYGPQPPGPEIIVLDALIVIFSCIMVWLILNVWIWTFN